MRTFSPKSEPFRLSLGERGEMIAWNFLIKKGYKLVEKNYRTRIGEMDVIAEKKGRLVFIEIKTRRTERFGRPEEAVTVQKQRKLFQIASYYLKEKKKENIPISFAVLAVHWPSSGEPEFRLIEDALEQNPLIL